MTITGENTIMNRHTLLTILTIITFALAGSVLADYNFITQYGNNGGATHNILGTGTTGFTKQTPVTSNTGSASEPLIYDLNNDGIQEILVNTGNNGYGAYEGNDATFLQDEIAPGDLVTTPAICNFTNGAEHNVVGVFNNVSGNFFRVIRFTADKRLETVVSTPTNATNIYGNVVCEQFYSDQGDTKTYAYWMDLDNNIYEAHYDGANVIIVINPGQIAGFDPVTLRLASNFTTTTDGADQILYQDDSANSFDFLHHKSIVFFAGQNIMAYNSIGHVRVMPLDTNSRFNGLKPTGMRLLGNVRWGGAHNGVVAYTTGTTPGNANTQRALLVRENSATLSQQGNTMILPTHSSGCTSTPGVEVVSGAIGDENHDGISDLYLTSESQLGCPSNGQNAFAINIYNMNNQSLQFQSIYGANTIPGIGGSPGDTPDHPGRMFLLDANNDGITDVLYMVNMGTTWIFPGNAATVFSGQINIFNVTTATNPGFVAPTPVDYNRDTLLDMVYTSITSTLFYGSGTVSNVGNLLPFTVSQNSTANNKSIQKITALYNATDYNYAATCDISSTTIWNEVFKTGYNFTNRSVTTFIGNSTDLINPATLLTFDGLTVPIDGNTITVFDLQKDTGFGVRDLLSARTQYTTSQNQTMTFLLTGSDSQPTYDLLLVKQGQVVTAKKYDPLTTITTTIGNTTIIGDTVTANIEVTPKNDFVKNYFTVKVIINNVTVSNTTEDTYNYGGTDMQTVELFTRNTTAFTLNSLSLFKTPNFTPQFTDFQNGQILTVQGVTVTTPSPAGSSITGDGYVVIPNYNNVYYSQCSYPRPGTYTQRHYVWLTGQLGEYTNFHDLTVVVSAQTSFTPGNSSLTGVTDSIGGFFNNIFGDFGIVGAGTKLIIWLFLAIALAVCVGGAIGANNGGAGAVVGILVFVVAMIAGSFPGIEMVPIWVNVIFVLVAAGTGAVFGRMLLTGGS